MSGTVYLMLSIPDFKGAALSPRPLKTAIFPSGRKIHFSLPVSPADAGEYLRQGRWQCAGVANLKTDKILNTDAPFPLTDPSVMTLLSSTTTPAVQKEAIAKVLEDWKKGSLFRPVSAFVSGPVDFHPEIR